jgi:hypothetical protein
LERHIKKTFFYPKASNEKQAIHKSQIRHYKKIKRPIVYIDESGFAKDSPRTHGYSSRGERCYGLHDWNARGRINVIGAITKNEFLTSVLIDENINSEIFYQWVIDDLLKIVPENSVIVIDNASFHKKICIKDAIEKAGHKLLYLPTY